MERVDGGALAQGGPVTLLLSATIPLEIGDGVATATVQLAAGDEVHMAVQYAYSWEDLPGVLTEDGIADALADTAEAWRSWGDIHQSYHGPFADWVNLSGRILQGLTFVPTGAIVAAPSTSLPEVEGGARNWDYRFAWVRDASLTVDALWVAACPDEEHHFFRFLPLPPVPSTTGSNYRSCLVSAGNAT